MRLKNLLILSVLLLLIQCTEKTSSDYTIEASFASTAPEIDGKANDPIWQQAKPIALKNNRTGMEVQEAELQTHVKAGYDNNTLYFLFVCKDPDIWAKFTQRDEYLWKEEAVEVFIDVDNIPDTYVEIEVSPANILFDSYIVDPENIDVPETAKFNLSGLRTGVTVQGTLNKRDDIDNSWMVEMAIPFKDLANATTERVGPETEIKLNFYRLDKNQGKESASYAWSPTGKSFHKPSVFGKLVFK
ncbi:carbohydrate-binding family 9-like protein [uncultured Cyclobacterium sp.]|uniref:carbohydrate-binding family 9-like protein n=1 Tax=uncultured Cyclobacterium sp. TaxID=453820 RepID=UPI0030EC55F8|tara:strand:- start:29564 stop:30295 length:732 start_codon:yes stop_codon:yes gene_type:complete